LFTPWIAVAAMRLGTRSHCTHATFDAYPSYLLVLALPVLAGMIWYEFQVMRFMLPAWMPVTGPLMKMGGAPAPFIAWFGKQLCLSLLNHLEPITFGLFVAKTLRVGRCSEAGRETANSVWPDILRSHFLTGWCAEYLSLFFLAVLLWILDWVQIIFPIGWGVPVENCRKAGEPIDYSITSTPARYTTLFSKARNTHADALEALSVPVGMGLVVDPHFHFMAKQEERQSSRGVIPRPELTLARMQRVVLAFFCFKVCKTAVGINLQVELFRVVRKVTGRFDYQTILSFCLSMLTAVQAAYTEMAKMKQYKATVLRSSRGEEHTVKSAQRLEYCFWVFVVIDVGLIVHACKNLFLICLMWHSS